MPRPCFWVGKECKLLNGGHVCFSFHGDQGLGALFWLGLGTLYVNVFTISRLMMAGCWAGGEQRRGCGGDECRRRFMMTN